MADEYTPKVGFMIIGVQKGGTSALAHYLSQHHAIGMSSIKENHIFDAPEYSSDWSVEEIDAHYLPAFAHCQNASIWGEATPIYLFLPEIAQELQRYNPNLKLIVLLRDRVERAISHYYMEKNRGAEARPLWLALLSEPLRLGRCKDQRSLQSPMRVNSYRRRGLYSLQLQNIYRFFPKENILIIASEDLRHHHDSVLTRVFEFLGVQQNVQIDAEPVFEGSGSESKHRFSAALLRLSYLVERRRFRQCHRLPEHNLR